MSEDQSTMADEIATKLTEQAAPATEAPAEKPKEPTIMEQLAKLKELRKEGPLSLSQELLATRLQKKITAQTRNQKTQRKMFETYFLEPQKKRHEKLMKRVDIVREQIGKADFKMLRDIFTVNTPEQKDDTGKVVQAASSQVNYEGLLKEALNVIAMQREGRMEAGLRKRSTGRSSDRRAHRTLIKFLHDRSEEEAARAAAK